MEWDTLLRKRLEIQQEKGKDTIAINVFEECDLVIFKMIVYIFLGAKALQPEMLERLKKLYEKAKPETHLQSSSSITKVLSHICFGSYEVDSARSSWWYIFCVYCSKTVIVFLLGIGLHLPSCWKNSTMTIGACGKLISSSQLLPCARRVAVVSSYSL